MLPQQYCLRWKHHHSNVQSMFAQLLEKERFCDVTLYCSPSFVAQLGDKDALDAANVRGVSLRAHRVVLAACSELLGALLGAHEAHGEPVLVIDGAEPKHVRALLDYMYTGEMSVHHSQLAGLLRTAEELRIKGLTDIRWNNKDEPPDSHSGAVTATSMCSDKPNRPSSGSNKTQTETIHNTHDEIREEPDNKQDKVNVNGGPPPLIKLPPKDKPSPIKRDLLETDSPSPKRQRLDSGSNEEDPLLRPVSTGVHSEAEWQHGNMSITAERVVGWGPGQEPETITGDCGPESDDEWADAPADIGSFLHTRLRVDGDNSGDDDSGDEATPSIASSDTRGDTASISSQPAVKPVTLTSSPSTAASATPKASRSSGPTDRRFGDVVKLNDYLQYGRRPQFWEEPYVKRVMEAVRIKELEMKQAAEILGVSYGTLYGRYRDVYGCINRPYREFTTPLVPQHSSDNISGRFLTTLVPVDLDLIPPEHPETAREFWQAKGPSEVLERLQRGDMTVEAGALALGVSPQNLAAYMADVLPTPGKDDKFEPIPIEIDRSLVTSQYPPSFMKDSSNITKQMRKNFLAAAIADKVASKKPPSSASTSSGNVSDEESLPLTVIATNENKKPAVIPTATVTTAAPAGGKYPAIRVASLDSLRGDKPSPPPSPGSTPPTPTTTPASPSQLMKSRPDLTILPAPKKDDENGT